MPMVPQKELWELKRDCHNLMTQIWGTDRDSQSLAYAWLKDQFGKTIHFSEVKDLALVRQIYDRLSVRSILEVNKNALDTAFDSYRREDYKYKRILIKKKLSRPKNGFYGGRRSPAHI